MKEKIYWTYWKQNRETLFVKCADIWLEEHYHLVLDPSYPNSWYEIDLDEISEQSALHNGALVELYILDF